MKQLQTKIRAFQARSLEEHATIISYVSAFLAVTCAFCFIGTIGGIEQDTLQLGTAAILLIVCFIGFALLVHINMLAEDARKLHHYIATHRTPHVDYAMFDILADEPCAQCDGLELPNLYER